MMVSDSYADIQLQQILTDTFQVFKKYDSTIVTMALLSLQAGLVKAAMNSAPTDLFSHALSKAVFGLIDEDEVDTNVQ